MPTLEQIQQKMKKLQVQADTLIAKKAQAAVDQIRKIMLTHGLTTVDIEVKAKAKRESKAANGSTPNVKVKVARSLNGGTPPKFQHPKTGATWTGHGRAPAWIADAKDRAKFLIASGTDVVRAASVSPVNPVSKAKTAAKKASVAAGALASKGQRKGPQPAKYLDPKTGATWSGRGPAPAWLAAVKDRTRFLVDGADVGSANAASAKLPGKKTSVKKVAEKKAVATKPAAKKALTAKTVGRKVAVNTTQKPSVKKTPTKKTSPKSAAVSTPLAVVETSVG
ncbi:H-NS histone family protein [Caballeronia sp. LjRoot34]|uniref:H-NS family nucleoid-associated regulatory protein n=1 Tax=Caballeronia sp. LjRoot34 TaxID=3342325 RepID=UPI003ECFC4F7